MHRADLQGTIRLPPLSGMISDSFWFESLMHTVNLLEPTKAVTDVTFRQDICRTSRIVFYLLAQLVDQDPQIFALVAILRPPNRG
jgi:hypothetical protein